MLSVLTTVDFAAWFRGLGDRDAEEVATGIEVVEALGPERSPPASSELLLWYQSPSGSSHFDRFSSEEIVAFATRTRRVMQHLASDTTRRRLEQLSGERAERVGRSLALIGARARLWRNGLVGRNAEDWQAVLNDYREALAALELSEPEPEPAAQALRELRLVESKPGMRVLYGVDATNARALVILGEALDRRAYGPSVRRALSVWQQFLASGAEANAVAAGSSR